MSALPGGAGAGGTAAAKTGAPRRAGGLAAVVGVLAFVEFTSGIIQGYYTPLFTDIARSLGIHDADVNWFEGGQLMVSALVLPLVAKLGDRLGYRRMLLASTVVVAVASVAIAFAPNFWTFLIAWAVQGVYAVWLPLEIALVFRRAHRHPGAALLTRRAAGVLVAALEIGAIAGALGAGQLAGLLGGRLEAILLVPAAIVICCLVAIALGVRDVEEPSRSPLDTAGLVLISLALLTLTTGLSLMRVQGPGNLVPWAAIVVGCALFWPFARHELRAPDPLIDIRTLRSRGMWPLQLTAGLFGVSVLGAQAPLSTFARTDASVYGYGLGASAAGASVLIGTYLLAMIIGALLMAPVSRRIAPRHVLIGAAVLVGIAYAMFLPFHATMLQVLTNMLLAGLGSGALVAALPAGAAAAAPPDQTSMATGLTNSTKTVGGAFASCVFGIALAGGALGAAEAAGAAEGTAGSLAGYMLVWTICSATAFASAIALLAAPRTAFGGAPARRG